MEIINAIIPIALGVSTKYIFAYLKKYLTFLDGLPAPFQQGGVLLIAVLITWGATYVPGLESLLLEDPEISAALAAATAYAVHKPSS